MTTHLPERLRSLADEAPEVLPVDDLWRTGRRVHRTRVATSLAVVGGVTIAMLALGFGDLPSSRPDPAAPPPTQSGPMAIPDQFFTPSPWLPSTRSPGRLVAVDDSVTEDHVFGGPTDGVLGVAAGSQRYSFLDLPGRLDDSDVSLAPDGLHLAYVVTGTTTEDPEPDTGGGIAVLDLMTGHIVVADIPSQHGLNMADVRWAGPTTLLIQVTRVFDAPPGASVNDISRGAAFRWTVGDPAPVRLAVHTVGYNSESINVPGGAGYLAVPKTAVTIDPATGKVTDRIRLSRGLYWGIALSGDGRRIAGLHGNHNPTTLTWGRVRDGHVRLRDLPGEFDASVLGWSDPRHVVASRFRGPHGSRWVRVDVRTGSSHVLVRQPGGAQVATDALTQAHTSPAVAPPRPWNRRLELIALLVIAALGGVALLVARVRRV